MPILHSNLTLSSGLHLWFWLWVCRQHWCKITWDDFSSELCRHWWYVFLCLQVVGGRGISEHLSGPWGWNDEVDCPSGTKGGISYVSFSVWMLIGIWVAFHSFSMLPLSCNNCSTVAGWIALQILPFTNDDWPQFICVVSVCTLPNR